MDEHQGAEVTTNLSSITRIVERIGDSIVVVSRSGHILFANPSAERLFARSRSELLGESFDFPVDSIENIDVQIIHKTGEVRFGDMCTTEVLWGGELAHLVSIRDITERKEAEALQDAEQLAPVEQLAAGVVHEINNPATFVLANMAFLKDDVARLKESLGALERYGASCPDKQQEAFFQVLREQGLDARLSRIRGMLDEAHEGIGRIVSVTQELNAISHGQSAPESLHGSETAIYRANAVALMDKQRGGSPDCTGDPPENLSPRLQLLTQTDEEMGRSLGEPVMAPDAAPGASLDYRILIVDDEPIVRRILMRILDSHDVVEAEDGQAALEAIAENKEFDLIFCDLMMPNINGAQVYDTLMASAPELIERIIFLTGGAFTARVLNFISVCKRPLLAKPFTNEEILDAVNRYTPKPLKARSPHSV